MFYFLFHFLLAFLLLVTFLSYVLTAFVIVINPHNQTHTPTHPENYLLVSVNMSIAFLDFFS